MAKENFTVAQLVNDNGCFDLQFRKDTRHERTGSPTYYRWKIQFVITLPKEQIKVLQKVAKALSCGKVTATKDQARFSVQDIDDIFDELVPQIKKTKLQGNKKNEFHLWQKALEIIYNNKGKYISKWEKSDLNSLIEIHKSLAKYKVKPKQSKWLEMAKTITKNIRKED